MASKRSASSGSKGDELTPAEVVSKTTTQPAASPFTVQETLSRLDPARTTALKALAAGQSMARASELSGLGPAAIKTLKAKYLPAIRQANAAMEWQPGTDDVKEAAQRWAGQAGAAHALATELVLQRLQRNGATMTSKELAETSTTLTSLTRSCTELLRITGGLG